MANLLTRLITPLTRQVHPLLLANQRYLCAAAVATEPLKQKWRHIFNYFDANRDGVLSLEDYYQASKNFHKSHEIKNEKTIKGILLAASLAEKAIQSLYGADKSSVTREEFVASYTHLFELQHGLFRDYFYKFFDASFDIIDRDKDGYIRWSEFQEFYMSSDDSEETAKRAKLAFATLDGNDDGKISWQEYVDAHMKFAVNTEVRAEDIPLYGPHRFH